MATSANTLEGFFVELGFDIDDKGLSEMADKVRDTSRLMGTLVGLVTGPVAAGLGLFVAMTAKSIDALRDLSIVEDVAIETVQELGFAAGVSGSSVEAMRSSISGLNRVIGEAALGVGRGRLIFEKLGLSAKDSEGNVKDFDTVLGEVADKIQTLSAQEAIALTGKLGIDRSLIPLLRGGAEALSDLQAEARSLGLVTQEEAQQADALNDSIFRWKFLLTAVKDTIAIGLMPAMTGITDGLREWFLQNRAIITSGFSLAIRVFTGVAGQFWEWLRAIVSTLIDVVRWLLEFRLVLYAVIAAMGIFISLQVARIFGTIAIGIAVAVKALMAFNVAALLTPALIGAIIIAVGLLIDDFLVWKDGGESLIGELVGGFPQVVERLKEFFSPLQTVINFFGRAYDAAVKFGSYIKETLSGVLGPVWDKLSGLFGGSINAEVTSGGRLMSLPSIAPSGILGAAAMDQSRNLTQTQSTTIGEMNVSIQSPNPQEAGSNFFRELERRNISLTRNSQSQVVL